MAVGAPANERYRDFSPNDSDRRRAEMHIRSVRANPTYIKQLASTENRVISMPLALVHQSMGNMAEEGHKMRRRSVPPKSKYSQMPYLQRRPRTVPDTASAAAPAMVAVSLALIWSQC
jgi:hypothetical protein